MSYILMSWHLFIQSYNSLALFLLLSYALYHTYEILPYNTNNQSRALPLIIVTCPLNNMSHSLMSWDRTVYYKQQISRSSSYFLIHYIITIWQSPKSQIIFHKRATKCRAFLRKMTYSDEGSYESWPCCKKNLILSHSLYHNDMTISLVIFILQGGQDS